MYCTNTMRNDGFGAIFQNIIYDILFTEYHENIFIYLPYESIDHNYNNDPKHTENLQKFMNLQDEYKIPDGFKGSVRRYSIRETYDFVESKFEELLNSNSFLKIKNAFFKGKHNPFDNNKDFLHVAVHIRRPNSRDDRTEGADTPNSYYLNIINHIRKTVSGKPLKFHIFSQGDIQKFSDFFSEDTVFHLDEEIQDTFLKMVYADILVCSRSSFSYAAALLSDSIIYYEKFWHPPRASWISGNNINYKIVKKQYNDKLFFKLCSIGFALECNLLFTNRITIDQDIDLVKNLNHGDKIFISIIESDINYDKLVEILSAKNIKVYFYIMYEPIVPAEIINKLMPVSIHFFIQNNVYESPMISCMPIGIRDCEKVVPNHKGFSHDFLYKEGLKTVDKTIACLLCFSYTHEERYRCYHFMKDEPFVVNLNDNTYEKQESIHCGKVPVWINYEYIHKSMFVLCPRGCGEDTHRFYEAIYLDSIPIVKRSNTPFDKVYEAFPCLVVNDWLEITDNLLSANVEPCFKKLKEFKYKYPNAFTDLNSIQDLLLRL